MLIFEIPIMMGAGGFMCGIGLYLFSIHRPYLQNGLKTSGVIVDHQKKQNTGEGSFQHPYIYYPIFEYQVNASTFRKESHYGSTSLHDFPIGKKVTIYYLKNDPQNSKMYSWFKFYGFGLLFTVLGFSLWLGGIFRIWKSLFSFVS